MVASSIKRNKLLCALLLIKGITFLVWRPIFYLKAEFKGWQHVKCPSCMEPAHPSDGTILSLRLWHTLFSPALHERVLQEVSLACWAWTLYFPEGVLFVKPSVKRWGLEQITWTELITLIELSLPSDTWVGTTNAPAEQRCWTQGCVPKQNFCRESNSSKNDLKLDLPCTWNWGVENLPCAPQETEEGLQAVGCWLLWDASLCQGMWAFSPQACSSRQIVPRAGEHQHGLQAEHWAEGPAGKITLGGHHHIPYTG